MSYVRLKGKRWYIEYNDARGERRTAPTSAQTKTEVKRLALELDRKVERQRLGLEPLPSDSTTTFWELCHWWLERRCRPRSREDETYRLEKHVKGTSLGDLILGQVTKTAIADRLLEMERAGAAAGSVNKLRAVLHTVIHRARQEDPPLWSRPNPVELVESRRVPKRVYETLDPDDVERVLAQARTNWRGEIATAVYMGLRKGEILGLRKADVDLQRLTVTVRRSFDSTTTKTDEEATVPIPPPLRPYLKHAIDTAPGDLVFPGPGGRMRTEEADPEKALRRALGRAGLVQGYDHVCRRCKGQDKQPNTWRHADNEERRCPTCGFKLWAVPIPRPMRFHDLRHSTATILLSRGVEMHLVQRILRHAQVSTTVDLYGHMVVEHLRDVAASWGTPGERQPPPVQKAERPDPRKSSEVSGPSEWALLVLNQRPPPCEISEGGSAEDDEPSKSVIPFTPSRKG